MTNDICCSKCFNDDYPCKGGGGEKACPCHKQPMVRVAFLALAVALAFAVLFAIATLFMCANLA